MCCDGLENLHAYQLFCTTAEAKEEVWIQVKRIYAPNLRVTQRRSCWLFNVHVSLFVCNDLQQYGHLNNNCPSYRVFSLVLFSNLK